MFRLIAANGGARSGLRKLCAVIRSSPEPDRRDRGAFDEPKDPDRHAVGQLEDAPPHLGRVQHRRPTQRKHAGEANQELRQTTVVLPSVEMKGLEALGELLVDQEGLASEIRPGADQRRPQIIRQEPKGVEKILCRRNVPASKACTSSMTSIRTPRLLMSARQVSLSRCVRASIGAGACSAPSSSL
jgi:hypothetical protein